MGLGVILLQNLCFMCYNHRAKVQLEEEYSVVRKLKSKNNNAGGGQMDILKQAQAMQQEMLKIQEGLKEKELETSVGGGAVTVKINGQKEILEIKLSDEIVKEAAEDDKEMLEDLVLSAVSEAMRQAEELAEKEMGQVTGGINIPGLI